MSVQKKRNGEIDVLRFFFSLLICFFHWNANYELGYFKHGNIAVDFFFIVSGYLMAVQISKIQTPQDSSEIASTTWKLLLRKLKSFYPYYLGAFLLTVVIQSIYVQKMSLHDAGVNLMRSIPTLTLSFQALNMNKLAFSVASTWFLSAMMIAMLILYPLLLKGFQFTCKIICPLIFLFIVGYHYHNNFSLGGHETWTGLLYGGTLKALSELSLGIFMYAIASSLQNRWENIAQSNFKKLLMTCLKLFLYGIVIANAYGIEFGAGFNLHAMLFSAIAVMLSFNGVGFTIPDHPITRYLGKASLGIYIFHGVIRWSVKGLIPDIGGSTRVFFGMALGSIVLSIFLMHMTDLVCKLFSICHFKR